MSDLVKAGMRVVKYVFGVRVVASENLLHLDSKIV